MTDIDYRGKRVNKPKEIWLTDWSEKRHIEEYICNILNTIKLSKKDLETISNFTELLKKLQNEKQ